MIDEDKIFINNTLYIRSDEDHEHKFTVNGVGYIPESEPFPKWPDGKIEITIPCFLR